MSQVAEAISAGRCSLAIGGALLRDPDVMLQLSSRASLKPMALAGPAVSPVVPVGDTGVARALSQKNGVVVLIEPETSDAQGLAALGKLLSRGPNKPKVIVVARNYNPFSFGTALRGLKVEHERGRGKKYLSGLPTPTAEELPDVVALPKAKKPTSDIPAPMFNFVGRDEELAIVADILGQGGPFVLSGGAAVGRGALMNHAIAASELSRKPDLYLGRGTGADALAARLAEMCAQAGSPALKELLEGKERTPKQVVDTAIASLKAADSLAGSVMVVHNLDYGLGPDIDFFRRSRLELLLEALLTNEYPLRLVFISQRQPQFNREGQAAPLRRLVVAGVKGKFLHELFEAYKAPEFARDNFGPISERIHGHPVAARHFAIALRDQGDNFKKLLEEAKFMRVESVADTAQIKKRIGKKLAKLPKDQRAALSLLAHARVPMSGTTLAELKINRKVRLSLLAAGLLDMVGTMDDKSYRVHPLVKRELTWREVSDYDAAEKLVDIYTRLAAKAEDAVEKLAWQQEVNRCAMEARKSGARIQLSMPDQDAWIEAVRGMFKDKRARPDLMHKRIREAITADTSNADAWLLLCDLARRSDSKAEAMIALFDEAQAAAPVPELYHQAVGFWMSRRKRGKAIEVLEAAVAALPDEPRLHTRLASMLMAQGRRTDGLEHLKRAMELAPMLPDAYGLMGQAKRAEGAVEEAEGLLREAVRLGADDPVQVGRLVDLLMARARLDLDAQDALRKEAKEILDHVIAGDRPAGDALLLLATLVRESTGDAERAAWLLKKARKNTDRGTDRHRRVQIEASLQAMASGKLDEAENNLRQRCGHDPADHRGFGALANVLEARDMFVPAHAEYMRALERAPKNSLAAQLYERHMKRLQAVIEAQAAGLYAAPETAAAPEERPAQARIVRRRKDDDSAEAAPAAAEAVEGAPEAVEGAPEAVEGAPEAVEGAPEAVEAAPEAVETAPEAVEATVEVVEAAPEVVETAPESVEAAPEAGGADIPASEPGSDATDAASEGEEPPEQA